MWWEGVEGKLEGMMVGGGSLKGKSERGNVGEDKRSMEMGV